MKIENRKTYQYFKKELEELLKAGFSREQAFFILKRIDHALNDWKGYHAYIRHTAGESLNYLIRQVTEEAETQELKEHILDSYEYRLAGQKYTG